MSLVVDKQLRAIRLHSYKPRRHPRLYFRQSYVSVRQHTSLTGLSLSRSLSLSLSRASALFLSLSRSLSEKEQVMHVQLLTFATDELDSILAGPFQLKNIT
jgi:hypothetical protein